MTAEQIQDLLNHKDVLLAISSKRAKNQVELNRLQKKLVTAFRTAVAPAPRPTNTMDVALNAARNVFQIWQGISFGLKVVRGFRSAFKIK